MSWTIAPIPGNVPQVDMRGFCHDGPPPDPPVGMQVVLIGELVRESGTPAMSGMWDLPAGAILTLDGSDAIVSLNSGSVTVWACGTPLVFDTVQHDDQLFQAPANSGVQIDSATTSVFYLQIEQSGGSVSLRADAATRLEIAINTTSAHAAICASATCWGRDDATAEANPILLDNAQPEICIRNWCVGP